MVPKVERSYLGTIRGRKRLREPRRSGGEPRESDREGGLKQQPLESAPRPFESFVQDLDDAGDAPTPDEPGGVPAALLVEEAKIGCTLAMLMCLDGAAQAALRGGHPRRHDRSRRLRRGYKLIATSASRFTSGR